MKDEKLTLQEIKELTVDQIRDHVAGRMIKIVNGEKLCPFEEQFGYHLDLKIKDETTAFKITHKGKHIKTIG